MPFAHLPFSRPKIEPHSLPEVAPSLFGFIRDIPNPYSPRLSSQNVLLTSGDQMVRGPWRVSSWTTLGEAAADRAPGVGELNSIVVTSL